MKKQTYTHFVTRLIAIILADNTDMTAGEIALTESDLQEYFNAGISPETVYHEIWQGDAGNYWAC